MQPKYATVEKKIDQIEAEMRQIGIWQADAPAAEKLEVRTAFGGDTMSFEQWLQFIFVPRVREIIATQGEFPATSQVAARATREWDTWGGEANIDPLLKLLRQFDAMFK